MSRDLIINMIDVNVALRCRVILSRELTFGSIALVLIWREHLNDMYVLTPKLHGVGNFHLRLHIPSSPLDSDGHGRLVLVSFR
jgi:hypothetical protein